MRLVLSAALLAVLLIASPAHAEWQRRCGNDSVNNQLICWISAWATQPDGTELWLRLLIYPERVRVMVIATDEMELTVPAILRVDRNAPWTSEEPRTSYAMFPLEESDAIAHEIRMGRAVAVQARIGVQSATFRYNLLGTAEAIESARRELMERSKSR
jgi:hypothetical protein